MKIFFENLEVNNWLSSLLLITGIVALIYVVYFFFSKEGKDERGRGIFAKSSMISFISMVVMLNVAPFFDKYLILNKVTMVFGLVAMFTIFCCIQAVAIFILKNRR